MNKKRIIILALVVLAVAMPAMATDYGSGRDMGAGKFKAGTIIGNGFFGTVGFDTGGITEINFFAGTGWSFSYLTVGANMLFTLVDINIEDQIFPLSFGPQVGATFYTGGFQLDILAMLRWEYTFWFPLNVFVEIGPGLNLDFWNSNVYAGFGWAGGVGVRYVFGM